MPTESSHTTQHSFRPEESVLLLVDDDLLMRKSMAAVLANRGYEVVTAENGREALSLFDKVLPDLVLLDLRMPGMDGIQVLSALGEKVREHPVLIVSGGGSLDDAVSALKLGAWDYIVKPVDDAVLEHAVAGALERLFLLRENRRYQQHLEKEVRRRTAELHRAQKMEAIGTLAGGIAHDFNNILAVIIGYCEIALDDIPADSRAAADLKKALSACDRAADLVRQILVFSRQTEDDIQLVKVQYLLKEAVSFLESSFPATISIQSSIDMDCGPVEADPVQIRQIVLNLCVNARQAMIGQGGRLVVELSEVDELPAGLLPGGNVAVCERYVRLLVSDTGHGMDEDQLDRIFDPFYSTRLAGEGSGLGLSVVYGIVEKLGGAIGVHSRKGQGTAFRVFLPVADKADKAGLDEETAVSGPVTGQGERIMMIDDDTAVVAMMSRMLEDLGYRVSSFTDSAAALRNFSTHPAGYDLVVTDMTMPGLTGRDLAAQMLAIRPDIPIVMCTGFSEQMDRDQAMSLGIREFVMKPVVKRDLARILNKVLADG